MRAADTGITRGALTRDLGDVVIHQLWGPYFDLLGNGAFSSVSFGWVLIKIPNLIEIILVVVLFVAGMFINLPDRTRRRRVPTQ